MVVKVEIVVPERLIHYAPYLDKFVEGMLIKLLKNAHKEKPSPHEIPMLLKGMRGEVKELSDQCDEDMFAENSLIEAMDVANFALLTYVALRQRGVRHGEKTPEKAPD